MLSVMLKCRFCLKWFADKGHGTICTKCMGDLH